MGYEGHLMMVEERSKRIHLVEKAMALLLDAAAQVGGDIISAGGTGTYDTNTWASEIQRHLSSWGLAVPALDLPSVRRSSSSVRSCRGRWLRRRECGT